MKILHTADLHLKSVDDERWQALGSLLKLAEEKKVDALTISGDLFDQNFAVDEARGDIRSVFNRFDLPVFIIAGNHDSQLNQQGLDFGRNVQVISSLEQPINLGEATIYGLPFTSLTQEQLLAKLQQLKAQLVPTQTNILLFHGELLDQFFSSQDFGAEGSHRYLPVKLNYFADLKLDYVLAGHFHSNFKIHNLDNKRLKQGGFFVYPGSPISITQRETGPRMAALINLGSKPQALELKTTYYQPINLTIEPDQASSPITQIKKELKKLPPHALAIVKLSGYFDSDNLGTNEKELAQKLEQLAKEEESLILNKESNFQDINHILDSGLFQTFVSKLDKQQAKYSQPEELKQTLIQAMMKVNA